MLLQSLPACGCVRHASRLQAACKIHVPTMLPWLTGVQLEWHTCHPCTVHPPVLANHNKGSCHGPCITSQSSEVSAEPVAAGAQKESQCMLVLCHS